MADRQQQFADDEQQIETDQTDTGAAESGEDEQPETGEQTASEDTEAEAEGDESGDTQDKPQKRNRPGKLERQIERQQREIAELKGFVQSFTTQQQGNGGPQRTFEQQAPQAPKYEDFDSDEAYLDALADYKVNARLQEQETQRQRQERERQQQQEREQTYQSLQEKLSEGAAKYDDFEDVVYDESVPITDSMAEAMADSENAADIAYHLGSNPKEAARIAGLSATKQAREITRLEGRLASQQAQPSQKRQTKAPAPTQRVRGSGDRGTVDPDKMSMDEYVRWRRKQ